MGRKTNAEIIRARLGLPSNATEGDVLAAVDALKAPLPEKSKEQVDAEALRKRLGLPADASQGQVLEALKQFTPDPEEEEKEEAQKAPLGDNTFQSRNYIFGWDGDVLLISPKNRGVRINIYKREMDAEGNWGPRQSIEHVADRGVIDGKSIKMASKVQVIISPGQLPTGGRVVDTGDGAIKMDSKDQSEGVK